MPISRPLKERFEEKYFVNQDGCWEWTASVDGKGYGQINLGREGGKARLARAHRVSYELNVGEIPDGMFLDHICGVPKCVNPDHLRLATNQENLRHKGAPRNNTSGFKGVTYHKKAGKWMAQIKPIYLGLFDTPEEAYDAYCSAAKELHGRFFHP